MNDNGGREKRTNLENIFQIKSTVFVDGLDVLHWGDILRMNLGFWLEQTALRKRIIQECDLLGIILGSID